MQIGPLEYVVVTVPDQQLDHALSAELNRERRPTLADDHQRP